MTQTSNLSSQQANSQTSASGQTQRTVTKTNPATGEVLATYPAAGAVEVTAAVSSARQATESWNATPPKRRAKVLLACASAIYRQADALAELISLETGKPRKDALEGDVLTAMNVFRYYAKHGPALLAEKTLPPDRMSFLMGRLHRERRTALGLVAVISPWNYPLAIAASGIATTLMAGNTVVFKPSELTPGVGQALYALVSAALAHGGHERSILQLLQGDGETGALLTDSDVDAVIFTGSTRIGREIQQKMAVRNKVCSLELGSSDPCLLLPYTNLESAASYILWGRFVNAGQACSAIKRVYVHQSQEAELLALLQRKIERLRVDEPFSEAVHVGPVISERQLEALEHQVREAVAGGAVVLAGGQRLDRSGYFMAPTLVSRVSAECGLLREEVFGPVLPVVPYTDLSQAISWANDTPYGLTASVFGPDAVAVARRLNFGSVVINDAGSGNYAIPAVPWCGWNASGPGTSHGPHALLDLTRRQIVSTNLMALLPGFSAAPWLFSHRPHGGLGRVLLNICAGGKTRLLNPLLLWELWRNRASRKI